MQEIARPPIVLSFMHIDPSLFIEIFQSFMHNDVHPFLFLNISNDQQLDLSFFPVDQLSSVLCTMMRVPGSGSVSPLVHNAFSQLLCFCHIFWLSL